MEPFVIRREARLAQTSRLVRVAVVTAAAAALLVPAGARAGTYTVIQCDPTYNRGVDGLELSIAAPYEFANHCADRGPLSGTDQYAAARGDRVRFSWPAPPGTELVHVYGRRNLANDQGHKARIYVTNSRGDAAPTIADGGRGSGWHRFRWSGSGRTGFSVLLVCDPKSGATCAHSSEAHARVKELQFQFSDVVAPTVSASDSLLAGGWRRGAQGVDVTAGDVGGGIRAFQVTVNGVAVPPSQTFNCSGLIPGTALARESPPCVLAADDRAVLATSGAPFRDGANRLSACALDWAAAGAANRGCDTRTVRVDNSPPQVAFHNGQDPDDPDLIEAPVSDPYSGVAGGQISYRPAGATEWQPLATRLVGGEFEARVDSQNEPPGHYEFAVRAVDRVGNSVVTTKRQDGTEEVLEFPLKAQTVLHAFLGAGQHRLRVPYGTSRRLRGRLLTRDGQPVVGPVVVTEHFGEGTLIDRRVRTVTTDEGGRYRSKIPAGPSRSISVAYAGSSTYGDSATGGLHYAVRSKASFKTSRRRVPEGRRVIFRGRVRHYAARIPPGGKVIELQVKDPAARGGWNTIGQAFGTNQHGHYRVPYRFGNYFSQLFRHPVTFRFRVKVTREAGWPYATPAHSRKRKVTVLLHH
jgi:hypothetical protein